MKFANLHLHSTHSDASFTPQQLVYLGKSLGYKALALTDHETDSGVREFQAEAATEGLQAIVGVEFYGKEGGLTPHIVALDYDMNESGIRKFITQLCYERSEGTRKSFELGVRLGYIHDMTWADVLDLNPDGAWLCIDSVMNAMKLKKVVPPGYDWTDFRKVLFRSTEAKSFAPPKHSAKEVIETIRKAGGVAILAHPKTFDHLPALISYGLNGIEVCHPNMTPEATQIAEEAADVYKLYRSGGTDHSGPMSSCGGMNAIPASQGVDEEALQILLERRLG